MATFDEHLDNEFKRLGFEDIREAVTNTELDESLFFFRSREKIDFRDANGLVYIDFFIVGRRGESGRRPHISGIDVQMRKATGGVDMDGVERTEKIHSKMFYSFAGPLPTKDQMIQEVLEMEVLRTRQLEKAVKINKAGESKVRKKIRRAQFKSIKRSRKH